MLEEILQLLANAPGLKPPLNFAIHYAVVA